MTIAPDIDTTSLVERAHQLASTLTGRDLKLVCCHGDIHSGNWLLANTGEVHPVDWDTLSLAPREKDLMFIGAGIGGVIDVALGTSP